MNADDGICGEATSKERAITATPNDDVFTLGDLLCKGIYNGNSWGVSYINTRCISQRDQNAYRKRSSFLGDHECIYILPPIQLSKDRVDQFPELSIFLISSRGGRDFSVSLRCVANFCIASVWLVRERNWIEAPDPAGL